MLATACRHSYSMIGRAFHHPIRSLHVLRTIPEVRQAKAALQPGESLGFVPTMGALHQGHLDLVKRAKSENTKAIVSIFVNPAQFAPHEDLASYPRTLDSDLATLRSIGTDYVFVPTVETMYQGSILQATQEKHGNTGGGPQHGTYVDVVGINSLSEGSARPGFFRGVATVVTKLFNIVQPTRAYFGQKDGLQTIVIQRIVRELNMPVDVIVCPTTRESDGLAMSSRNVYLSPTDRAIAPTLYQSLLAAQSHYTQGERDVTKLKRVVEGVLQSRSELSIHYISISSSLTGEEIEGRIPDFTSTSSSSSSQGEYAMLAIAVRLGKTRLIDNCLLGKQT